MGEWAGLKKVTYILWREFLIHFGCKQNLVTLQRGEDDITIVVLELLALAHCCHHILLLWTVLVTLWHFGGAHTTQGICDEYFFFSGFPGSSIMACSCALLPTKLGLP